MNNPAIIWFRQDLRVDDHPALAYAAEHDMPIVPVYIYSPGEEEDWPPGGATKWWLHHSLKSLQQELEDRGAYLIFRLGESFAELKKIATQCGADTILLSKRFEPAALKRDENIIAQLEKSGIGSKSFNSNLLCEPGRILNKQGKPFKVFTAYWRTCTATYEPKEPVEVPRKLHAFKSKPHSVPLKSLELLPKINWDEGIKAAWQPGAAGAQKNLEHLISDVMHTYTDSRNRPDQNGVSRLSPHLHFGEISPNIIWHAVKDELATKSGAKSRDHALTYLKELGWREFAYDLLYHFPYSTNEPLYADYAKFPFRKDAKSLRAWHKGLTGYPMVDAGMRELWHTGWMHNRVRMIVASFLVKDLLLPWQAGARWFWDTLVDADLASNTMGWQWVAGSGADAAPYFRIFNPISQGQKFDPDGNYVRKWVPELKQLSTKHIHSPWLAPQEELFRAGVELGKDYPLPIVDHDLARKRALAALKETKNLALR